MIARVEVELVDAPSTGGTKEAEAASVGEATGFAGVEDGIYAKAGDVVFEGGCESISTRRRGGRGGGRRGKADGNGIDFH